MFAKKKKPEVQKLYILANYMFSILNIYIVVLLVYTIINNRLVTI
jgi:hypothetical protein